VHPTTCRKLGGLAAASGVEVIDAPVSGGGAKAAREARTVTLVGGTVEADERCLPIFETFGVAIHLGPLGSGQLTKLLNNVFFTVQMGASYELVRLALSSGQGAQSRGQAFLSERCRSVVTLDTDHSPFLSRVDDVADLLEDIMRR
jgi:3-hydroxyisobutyrate dehydrogenase-like beta-hydroxyacid dehydrogenase